LLGHFHHSPENPVIMKKPASKPTSVASAPTKKAAAKPAPKAAPIAVKKIPVASVTKAAKPAAQTKAAPKAKSGSTVISARIDIGFGNALHLRGDGPGLSWNQGVPLACVADDVWAITLPAGTRPVVFKFLVNDLTWSSGPDYIVASGEKVVLVPTF
jgi:hypothetical protein